MVDIDFVLVLVFSEKNKVKESENSRNLKSLQTHSNEDVQTLKTQ